MMRVPAVAWGGAAAMAIAMGLARFAYTPIIPAMHAQAGLSAADAGLLATANFAGYTVATLWPIFARRLGFSPGPKTTVRVALVACLVTTLGMATTESFALWALLRFASGLASALAMIYASTLVLDALAKSGRGAAIGVHYGGVGFGIALSGLMVEGLEPLHVGWRDLWLGVAILILLLMPLVGATLTRHMPAAAIVATPVSGSTSRWSRRPWWLIAGYLCAGLGFIVSGTFLPLIAKQHPETAAWASLSWVLVGLAAIPSNVLWAAVANRTGPTTALVAQYLLQALGVMLPVLLPTPGALLASGVLLGGTFMGIVTVANGAARALEPQRTAEIVGLMTAAYSLGQIVGPPLAGRIATSTGSFDGGLAVAAGTLLAGALLLVIHGVRQARS
jgi:MFS family permease